MAEIKTPKSIDELEAILNSEGCEAITINTDGTITRLEDDPILALKDIVEWWDWLPAKLRQDIEGSGAAPGCISKARRIAINT